MKSIAYVCLLSLLIAACTKAPTVEERLAGKTGEAREQEAYNICLERSRYTIPGGHSGEYVGHETRMWKLCNAMKAAHTSEEKASLAKVCEKEIKSGLKRNDPANVRHFTNIKKICEEMTGRPINVSVE